MHCKVWSAICLALLALARRFLPRVFLISPSSRLTPLLCRAEFLSVPSFPSFPSVPSVPLLWMLLPRRVLPFHESRPASQPATWDEVVSPAGMLLPGETICLYLPTCQMLTSSSPYITQAVRVVMTTYRLAFSTVDNSRIQVPLGDISMVTSEVAEASKDGKMDPSLPSQSTVVILCKISNFKVRRGAAAAAAAATTTLLID